MLLSGRKKVVREITAEDVGKIFTEYRLRNDEQAYLHEQYRPLSRTVEIITAGEQLRYVITAMMVHRQAWMIQLSVHAVAERHSDLDSIYADWVDMLSRDPQNKISIAAQLQSNLALLRGVTPT